ncbi:MAG: hypothetical protein MJ252_17695 [archaeon]|nr:hypothetical protein [archaeon]
MVEIIFSLDLSLISIVKIILICLFITFITLSVLGGLGYLYFILQFYRKDKNYKGKHIFIFGSSCGLGQSLAIRLSKQGIHLSIAARNERNLKYTQEECIKQNNLTIVIIIFVILQMK